MSPPEGVRVLLADDDHLVRTGIAAILDSAPDLRVTAQACDGAEALDLLRAHTADVALLDIRMPRADGLTVLARARTEQPGLPIGMLTTFSDTRYVAAAIGGGALGFLLKSDDPQHLLDGTRALAAGGAWFSPTVGRWLARREAGTRLRDSLAATDAVAPLSDRQRDVLAALGRGSSNHDIARELHLTEGTVKQYVSGLMRDLGVTNRVRAALLAYQAGLTGAPGDSRET